MFYESQFTLFRILLQYNTDGFRLHLHRNFECYVVTRGTATAVINDKEYFLSEGEAVLVFPYQRHKYIADGNADARVYMFSPDLVRSFYKSKLAFPESNKFVFPKYEGINPDTMFLKKAICYIICGEFDKNANYIKDFSDKDDLLLKLLYYINDNHCGKCTLEDAARYIGYDACYISRFFKRMTGQGFNSYVNDIRIGEACRLLRETDSSINEIADLCGFNTVRCFNQKFLKLVGETPTKYKNSLEKDFTLLRNKKD